MPVIILGLRGKSASANDRPGYCPYCGNEILQRWGASQKTVQDINQEVSEVQRYRCTNCGHTFRVYPVGQDNTRLSQRIRNLAAMAWALGLSSRDVVDIFHKLGIEINQMTVWRDGHELVNRLKDPNDPSKPVRYLIDQLFLKNKGHGIGTSIVVDLGDGKSYVLGKIDEVDPRKVMSWLAPFIKDLDIEARIYGTGVLQNFDEPGSGPEEED
jgi:transposase-like protein